MAAEFYEASRPDPGLVAVPSPQGATATAEALGKFGGELNTIADKMAAARKTTNFNDAITQGLNGFNELDTKYSNDPNYKDAPDRYRQDATTLIGGVVENSGLDPAAQAELRTRLTRLNIATEGSVAKAALGREHSANLANFSQQEVSFQQRYLAAGSDAERQAVLEDQAKSVQDGVGAGWITANDAQNRLQTFRQTAETSRVMQVIQNDPKAAMASLADPKQFPYLDPIRRQNLAAQATAAADEKGVLDLNLMAKRDPASAVATLGRVADPKVAADIFDRGVIQQESSGVGGKTSPAGALGLAQLMPDTARAAARRMGRDDVASLSDSELRQKLLSDNTLNRSLGLNEFQRLLDRYGGSLPAALAGYNAGDGRADKWHAAAVEKFGPQYSAEQFASLVPIKETHDYIGAVYAHLGARTNGPGLSANAYTRAETNIGSELLAQDAERRRTLAALAATERTGDPVASLLQDGYAVDPGRLAAYKQQQLDAAMNGDGAAARELRRVQFAEGMAPMIRGAYAMPPAELAASIAQEQQRLAQSGNVTGEERDRLNALTTVQSNINALKNTNPIGLAERAGLFRATPLPVNGDINDPAFAQALESRSIQAPLAAKNYDGALIPLKPDEAFALKNRFNQAGNADKVSLLASLATHLSPDVYQAAVKQIAGDDVYARVAGNVAPQNPTLARKVLEGAQLLEQPGVKPRAADVRTALGDSLQGQLYLSPSQQSDAIDAGLAVYAANRAGRSALFQPSDATGLRDALQEVTGPMVKINGRMTPVPAPFAAGAVARGVATVTAEDLAPFGGVQPGADPAWLASHAQLAPLKVGGSRYAVQVGDRQVMQADGRSPLIIDLQQLAAVQRARAAAELNADAPAAVAREASHGIAGRAATAGEPGAPPLRRWGDDTTPFPGADAARDALAGVGKSVAEGFGAFTRGVRRTTGGE